MKRLVSVVILLLVVFSIAALVYTQSSTKLKMAVGASSSKEFRDFFVKVYKDAGYELELVELPTLRQIEDLNNGNVDSIIFVNEETLKTQIKKGIAVGMGEGQPLFKYEFLGFVLTTRQTELNAKTDFKGLSIGYIQGNNAQAGMIARLGATAVPAADMNSAVLMLSAGRFDILMAVKDAPTDWINKNNLKGKIVELNKPLVNTVYYHVINENKKNIVPLLIKSLLKFKAEFTALIGG